VGGGNDDHDGGTHVVSGTYRSMTLLRHRCVMWMGRMMTAAITAVLEDAGVAEKLWNVRSARDAGPIDP
jgi:hypothetical protein